MVRHTGNFLCAGNEKSEHAFRRQLPDIIFARFCICAILQISNLAACWLSEFATYCIMMRWHRLIETAATSFLLFSIFSKSEDFVMHDRSSSLFYAVSAVVTFIFMTSLKLSCFFNERSDYEYRLPLFENRSVVSEIKTFLLELRLFRSGSFQRLG